MDQENKGGSYAKSDNIIIFLYRGLFNRKIDDGDNHYQIDSYRELMDEVEDFVFNNIHELVCLRQSQTDFKNVAARMAKHKQQAGGAPQSSNKKDF